MAFSLFPKNIKQWKVVLIAFLAATTFWFFNSLNKEYSTSFNYPVEFKYNTDSLISVRPLPKYISLDVTSGGWDLLKKTTLFSPNPLEIELENPANTTMISWIEWLPSVRDQIGDLTINQILQDTLRLQIEPILKKKVRLVTDASKIQLAENHRIISNISFQKDSTTLTGPKSFIDTLGLEYHVTILEDDIDNDFSQQVAIQTPRPALIKSDPSETEITFEVAEFQKMEFEIDVEVMNIPRKPDFLVDSLKTSVTFFAREKDADKLKASDFVLMADYNMITMADSSVLAIISAFPENIEEVKITPEVIKLSAK